MKRKMDSVYDTIEETFIISITKSLPSFVYNMCNKEELDDNPYLYNYDNDVPISVLSIAWYLYTTYHSLGLIVRL